jgi:hypothetical protein
MEENKKEFKVLVKYIKDDNIETEVFTIEAVNEERAVIIAETNILLLGIAFDKPSIITSSIILE